MIPFQLVEQDVVLNIPIHTEITHTPTEVKYEVYTLFSLIKYESVYILNYIITLILCFRSFMMELPMGDDLLVTNVGYHYTRKADKQSTVSLKDLSLCPSPEYNLPSPPSVNIPSDSQRVDYRRLSSPPTDTNHTPLTDLPSHVTEQLPLRTSSRISKQPECLNL